MSVTLHGPDGTGEPERREGAEPAPAPRPETPSERIINAGNSLTFVVDSNGRRIGFKQLSMMDSWDLEAIAGAQLSANEAWMARAMIAYSVVEIDGKRVPRANTMKELRAIFQRLGDPGMVAMLVHLSALAAETAVKAQQAKLAEIGGEEPDAGPPEGEDYAAAKN